MKQAREGSTSKFNVACVNASHLAELPEHYYCSTMWQVMHRPQLSWGWKSICDTPWRIQKKRDNICAGRKRKNTQGAGYWNFNNKWARQQHQQHQQQQQRTVIIIVTFLWKSKKASHTCHKSYIRLCVKRGVWVMRLTVTFPSENHRKRGHAHYEAICEAEKNYVAFPNARRKLKQFADSP